MPESLVIVESPTKVKTIKKYLGSDFEVKASIGHIKDLPKSKLGIDLENNFQPSYEIIPNKKKTISDLKKTAKNVKNIYLAPDPDREGEAIAWHVSEEITLPDQNVYRVLFNDLTKKTVLSAIRNPHVLDSNKYEAQQTRRILDRLVGYQISPLLWKKVRRGLSAGRVQSVATRIICERESEIENFVSEEYWKINATFKGKHPPEFDSRLFKINGKKATISSEDEVNKILNNLQGTIFTVANVEKKETKNAPPPPFTTSKLQQEASSKLRFSAKKTMLTAQRLYEGLEIGDEGSIGLITYMRTDSVRIADEAIMEVRDYISKNYDKEFLPAKPRFFKTSKSAQDAHEAIRPTSMAYHPQDIKPYLQRNEFLLYQLIWNRFVASQMNPATFDRTNIDIAADQYLFRAQGLVMTFPGYTILYSETKDENSKENENSSDKSLPLLIEGEKLNLIKIKPQQLFTQPPPRFSEATLVKELEEKGIGRPSTYATILTTIQDRGYASLKEQRFYPTELGILVNELLINNFPKIFDIQFTASMENKLDSIEEGTMTRKETLFDFYVPFESELQRAEDEMRNIKTEETPTNIKCERCGSMMVIKWGKNGKFLACSNYPDCKNTSNFAQDKNGEISKVSLEETEIVCDQCKKKMVIKEGKYGRFLGCSGYPECTNTKPLEVGVQCPREGCNGNLCEKRSHKGKTFFGCSNYPDCNYALWDRPVPGTSCPECGFPFLVEKNQRQGTARVCPQKNCGYKETV